MPSTYCVRSCITRDLFATAKFLFGYGVMRTRFHFAWQTIHKLVVASDGRRKVDFSVWLTDFPPFGYGPIENDSAANLTDYNCCIVSVKRELLRGNWSLFTVSRRRQTATYTHGCGDWRREDEEEQRERGEREVVRRVQLRGKTMNAVDSKTGRTSDRGVSRQMNDRQRSRLSGRRR